MTYSQSAKGIKIGNKRIAQEMARHGHAPGSVEWQDVCQQLWKNDDIPPDVAVDAYKLLVALGY